MPISTENSISLFFIFSYFGFIYAKSLEHMCIQFMESVVKFKWMKIIKPFEQDISNQLYTIRLNVNDLKKKSPKP